MMVLADTSIWIDHFCRGDARLALFRDRGDIAMHSFVIGELVLGRVPKIADIIDDLHSLPRAIAANTDEVLKFISDRKLSRSGRGYVDPHLLAAAALAHETVVSTVA